MAYDRDCKTCTVSLHLSEQEIEEISGEAARVKQVKTATEEEYARRIAICQECDSLLYGTTCRHSGCVIQVRAKLAAMKCPYPYQPKW